MNEENKVIRLKDIAEALNTSINTVSHALLDKPDISAKMKERVKRKALELGYIPNSVAVSLRNGSTNTIAVAFDNLMNPYYMVMADKITTKLSKLNYSTLIYRLDNGEFSIDTLYKMFSRKVDGIISFSELSEEIVNACNKQKIPIILIGRKSKYLELSTISTNDVYGGYCACKVLNDAGCKNLAYLGAPKIIECSRRRKDGFRKYILENNLYFNIDNCKYLEYDNQEINEFIDEFIKNKVDGIFCFNDVIAFDTIKYLKSKNIDVPNQIKIVGYDALNSHFSLPFSVTSITSDKEKIIDKTIEILLNKIKKFSEEIETIEFDTYVFEGESCNNL